MNDALTPPWIRAAVSFTGVMGSPTRIKQQFLEQEEDHFLKALIPRPPPHGIIQILASSDSIKTLMWGFPGGSVVKKLSQPASAEDTDSIHDLGRAYMPWSN